MTRLHRIGALLAALAGLVPFGAAVSRSARAADPPTVPGVELSIVDFDMSIPPGGTVAGRLHIDGTVPDEYQLVAIAYPAVRARSAVRQVIRGGRNSTPSTLSVVALGAPAALADANGDVTVSIPTSDVPADGTMLINSNGIFPVSFGLRDATGSVRNEQLTFLERVDPTDRATLHIGIAADLDSPITLQPSGTRLITDDVRARLDRLCDLLERSAIPVDVALPPELLDGLAASDDSADQDRLNRLEQALGASHRVLAQPYVALDPSFAVGSGLSDEYVQQLRHGERTVADRLGVVTDRTVLFTTTGIDRPGIDHLRNLGVRDVIAAPEALVPDPELFDGTGGELAVIDTSDDSLPTLVDDPAVRPVLDSRDPAGDPRAVAADLFALAGEAALARPAFERGIVLTITDLASADIDRIVQLGGLLADNPHVSLQAPGDIARALERTSDRSRWHQRALVPATVDPDLNVTDALIGAREGIETTVTMLPESDPRAERWYRFLQVLPSTALSTAERDRFVSQLAGELGDIRSAVALPRLPRFNLGGTRTHLPLVLQNDSATPLTVVVRLVSANGKVAFEKNDIPVVVDGRTPFEIPIHMRSSGDTPVTVEVLTPGGPNNARSLIGPTRLSIRASFLTGFAKTVSGGFLLILATWWISHFRKAHRSRRAAHHAAVERHPAGTLPSS